jgi:hypothetical protein
VANTSYAPAAGTIRAIATAATPALSVPRLAARITAAFTANLGNNHCHITFLQCGHGVRMSTYLDELIRSVEAEASEVEAYLQQLSPKNLRSQHSRRNLDRILQRLHTLKGHRKN